MWVVQLSDLHISSYSPLRSLSFKKLVSPLLTLINPALVLITGDLTDGKSKDRATMRQDESEWVQYREAVDWVIAHSGLPDYAFFDMRGNHDKFGVPEAGGRFDYFSKYSISAERNRTSTVQSVTLLNGEWKHLFVGIDNSMDVGLRGPCNLFGHASNQRLEVLDRELSQWDGNPLDRVTKLVYGHFPTSFIASTENGRRPEEIFAKHNILAYLCGHLHYQFGRNLFKHHLGFLSKDVGEFWEWEMGDWKESRVMRIIAIDHGHASFLDLGLIDLNVSSVDDDLQRIKAFVLVTYPLDSQKMQRETFFSSKPVVEDSVRALVFSQQPVVSAKAQIYDSYGDLLTPIKELKLQQSSKDGDKGQYFVASLNMSNYLDPSPTRYFLQIVAYDSSGRRIVSDLRPFSASGHMKRLKWTWKEFFVMGIVWDALYRPLLWVAFCILSFFLILPKLHHYLMVKKGLNSDFSLSRISSTRWIILREVLAQSFETTTGLWWGQLFLLLYLMCMPWFWGMVLGDSYPTGSMSIRGWSIDMTGFSDAKWGLGIPDVIVIVLPYLYQVLLPVFVLVFSLSAERSMVQVHAWGFMNRPSEKEQNGMKCTGLDDSTWPGKHGLSCKLCKRWLRKALLVACLGVTYLHAQLTRAIVGAFGLKAMLISPGFGWPVPILLVAAILQTASVKSSPI